MAKAEKIWLDGKMLDWDKANVHVLTHSLHYGLGVFEGIRCYKREDGRSQIFRLAEHTRRLFASAHIAQMEIPYSEEEINKAIVDTLKANKLEEGYIRPLVFVGDGAMGLHPKENKIRVAIAAWSWGAYLGEEGLNSGIRVKVSSFTRHHVNVSMTKAKITGHYVNSIMAKREAVSAGYDEALLLDAQGYVSEASGENLFMVAGGVLYTPSPSSILKGITRDAVMRIATDDGLKVVEERLTRDELYIADEAFFTGTAAEVTPIREVDDRTIGTGKPGPITKNLQDKFFDIVKGSNSDYEEWFYYL